MNNYEAKLYIKANEMIELDLWLLGMYTCNFAYNFKKFMESLKNNNDVFIYI